MIPLSIAARIALAVIALVGCGGESEGVSGPGGAPAGQCAPPNRVVGDACREPGVQDDGCPAGTLGLGDGTCRPAGIAPEMCGEGFVHDGDVGCEPILPAETCPPGQMAVPGDTECHAVMPCAPGKWGDIAVDAMTTEHVDGSYVGGGSDGTAAKPWTTIGEAIAAAAPAATVAIAAGSYAEDIDILGKPVVLWGVCPDDVEIVGTGAEAAAIVIRYEKASGTVLRGLAIRGAADGIAFSGSQEVLVDRVWVHDNAMRGISIESGLGATSCTVGRSLIEDNHELGVLISGSEATVEATVVRGTLPDAQGLLGRGIVAYHDPAGAAATATVRSSLIDENRDVGVDISGAEATVEATVVRGTLPDAKGLFGRGIVIRYNSAGAPATAIVRSSVVEQNRDTGVFVASSNATIEMTTVRGTLPDAEGQFGRGIAIQFDPTTAGAPSTATVRASLVEQNHEAGVVVTGSMATVEGTVVRGTLPDALGVSARGIGIQVATATVRSSLVEQNHDVGVQVSGSDVTVEGTLVRGTLLGADGLSGRGINIQDDEATDSPSTAIVRSTLVEQSHEFGLVALSSDVTMEGCLVKATLPNSQARFGDGVSAFAESSTTLSVSATRIEDSGRAGVSSFGAFVSLGDTAVQCAAFDLEGEPVNGLPFTFDNRGGNVCGCPTAQGECILETVGIEPPTPVTPVE